MIRRINEQLRPLATAMRRCSNEQLKPMTTAMSRRSNEQLKPMTTAMIRRSNEQLQPWTTAMSCCSMRRCCFAQPVDSSTYSQTTVTYDADVPCGCEAGKGGGTNLWQPGVAGC